MEFEELELMATEDDFAMEGPDSPPYVSAREKDTCASPPFEDMDAEDFCIELKTQRSEEEKPVDLEMEEKLRRRRERFGNSEDEQNQPNRSTTSRAEGYSSNRPNNSSGSNKGRCSHTVSFNKARLLKPLYETSSLSPEILGREIAYRLEERKTIVIKNVVKVLGHNVAMDLFEETVKIQKGKGIKTADGKRRRSSGGVYLYLLKQHAHKEEWDQILKEDKVIKKQKEKLKKEAAKTERIQKMKKQLINRVDKIYKVEKDNCSETEDKNGKDQTGSFVSTKSDEVS